MELTALVLIPPVCVLSIALLSHNVLYALLGGIISACLLSAQGYMYNALMLMGDRLLSESSLTHLWRQDGNYDHAYTFGFLICLGIIIELMQTSGGLDAYATIIQKRIRSKRQAETLPLIAAPLFFLDDYLNNLVGGSVVRPLFDTFGIARAKLAYILNALSSSQCLLIPASSWLALILMQLQTSGVSYDAASQPTIIADPYTVYLNTIPYILYPILSIVSAWFIVRSGLSYGPMRNAEENATLSSNSMQHTAAIPYGSAVQNFIIPLASFLIGIPIALLYLSNWHPCTGSITWCAALQNTDALFAALWWASSIACIISSILLLWQRTVSPKGLMEIYAAGFSFMKGSLLLLLFAWTLSSLLKYDIPTGAYLAHHVVAHAPQMLIPLICFLTGTLITASIGSSWGMIGIMIPLCIPLITAVSTTGILPAGIAAFPLLFPTLGAILSGAAAGPHFSPITDAAIISSTTARVSPIEHIRTMLPYSIPPFIAASLGFVAFPLVPASLSSCIVIVAASIILMCLLHYSASYLWTSQQ